MGTGTETEEYGYLVKPLTDRIAVLEAALRTAKESIEFWGACASAALGREYDLAGDLSEIDKVLGVNDE